MKFNLEVTIANKDLTEHNKLYLVAEFKKVENSYGNGLYIFINGRGQTKFEQVIDLRYLGIDLNNLEIFLVKWVYNYWNGKNGAWDVIRLVVENIDNNIRNHK